MKSLVVFFVALLHIAAAVQPKVLATSQEHSFSGPYDAFAGIRNWQYGGSAVCSSQFVRMTPDRSDRYGFLECTKPNNGIPNWSAEFTFKVYGKGDKVFGDGFAFWYIQERLPRSKGPSFGGPAKFNGLMVAFDTFDNNGDGRNPAVFAVVNDGEKEFDHDMDGKETMAAGCQADIRRVNHKTRARVVYVSGVLSVELDIKGTGKWEECLEIQDVDLPDDYRWGFSAATGQVADNHEVFDFTLNKVKGSNPFYSIAKGARDAAHKAGIKSKDGKVHAHQARYVSSEASSWGFFSYLFMGLFLIVAIGGIGTLVLFSTKSKRVTL